MFNKNYGSYWKEEETLREIYIALKQYVTFNTEFYTPPISSSLQRQNKHALIH